MIEQPRVSMLNRLVLRSYPPSFRERYEDELAALVADGDKGAHVTADLVAGACRAWLRPHWSGSADQRRYLRLRATVSTIFVVWSLSIVVLAGFGRAVYDPPLFSATDAANFAYMGAMRLGDAVIAIGTIIGFVYWCAIVRRALRERRRNVWLPAIAPAFFVAAWVVVSLVIAVMVSRLFVSGTHRLIADAVAAVGVGLLAYVAFTLACVGGCIIGVLRAIRRSSLSTEQLQLGVWLAIYGSVAIGIEGLLATLCGLWVLVHKSLGVIELTQVSVSVLFFSIAVPVALVSSARGRRALHTRSN